MVVAVVTQTKTCLSVWLASSSRDSSLVRRTHRSQQTLRWTRSSRLQSHPGHHKRVTTWTRAIEVALQTVTILCSSADNSTQERLFKLQSTHLCIIHPSQRTWATIHTSTCNGDNRSISHAARLIPTTRLAIFLPRGKQQALVPTLALLGSTRALKADRQS